MKESDLLMNKLCDIALEIKTVPALPSFEMTEKIEELEKHRLEIWVQYQIALEEEKEK